MSFINHGKVTNIHHHCIGEKNLNVIYSKRDIKAGEEILLDYTMGTTD